MARNLELQERKENTRAAYQRPIQFDLAQIKTHFTDSINAVIIQFNIVTEFENAGKFEDSKTILRSQIVFAESILDFYLHEISKYALYQMFLGNWGQSEKYKSFKIPMVKLEEAITSCESKEWFFDYLNERFSLEVYLSAESMNDQLNLIGIPFGDVMVIAFPRETSNQSHIDGRKIISEMYKRRNQIAHQNDRSHYSAEQNDVTKDYVSEYIDNVKRIAEAVQQIAEAKG